MTATPGDAGRGTAGTDPPATISIALSEYAALANEIANRSNAQAVILNLNITAVGAVAAFALVNPGRLRLLLLLAFLCPALSFNWLDHTRSIANIGAYLSYTLWPRLRHLSGTSDLPTHEDWARNHEKTPAIAALALAPPAAVFMAPPIVSLAATFSDIDSATWWTLWALGLTLVLAEAAYWLLVLSRPTVGTYSETTATPYDKTVDQPTVPQTEGTA